MSTSTSTVYPRPPNLSNSNHLAPAHRTSRFPLGFFANDYRAETERYRNGNRWATPRRWSTRLHEATTTVHRKSNGFFSYTKGIIIARGRAVRRSKTETKIYRDATISSATIARNNGRKRKKMAIKSYNKTANTMPTRLTTTICPEEYHANRNAQEIWLFERGGKRLLESEDEDPYAQERKNAWFTRPEGSTSDLTANVENLYGLTKRVVARMFGK
jgi:hypothetical protein